MLKELERIFKSSRGVALFEILIVILLLSLLVLSSYLVVTVQLAKARDGKRKTDLLKIRNALEDYYDSAGEFPKELPECGEPLILGETVLLDRLPCDPKTKKPYYYANKRGTNTQYYRLYTLLENKNDLSIDFARCQGGCGPDCRYNYGISSTNVDLIRCSYVCKPGAGGKEKKGFCVLFEYPELISEDLGPCPKLYYDDSTCNDECGDEENWCPDASGWNLPSDFD